MKVRVTHQLTDARASAGVGGFDVVKEIDDNSTSVTGGDSSPPTAEIGAPAALGVLPWSQMWVGDPLETVPALQWPQSVWSYAAMLNDSQVDGLLLGSTIPIRRYKWYLDPNGQPIAKVKKLAADLNLPVEGEEEVPRGRLKKRFSWDTHLFHAFKALAYGFYMFEIVGEVQDDSLWHLTKLAPRPPLTIMDIDIGRHGDLEAIRQNVTQPGKPMTPIPASRLAPYVWEQEGANFTGRSLLRSIYKNWMIKDRLLRVDALKHERNGMGVPWATAWQGAGKQDLQALNQSAQRLKSGDTSGGVGPFGSKMELLGVQGTLPDTIASINYHDEAMARRFLMMFLQLGSTLHGSRALGGEFIDYFQLAQETMANWVRDTTNAEVIENYWDWNYGDSDTVPLICYKRDDDPRLAIEDLAKMVEKGIVRVDDELEEAVREVMDLPEFVGPEREDKIPPMLAPTDPNLPIPGQAVDDEGKPLTDANGNPVDEQGKTLPTPTPPSPPVTPGAGSKARRYQRAVAALGDTPLPDRSLRRQVYETEAASKINLAAMDSIWQQARDTLFNNWKEQVTKLQIEELTQKIRNTADMAKLSELSAAPGGQQMLVDAMKAMFEQGATLAAQEHEDQGFAKKELPKISDDLASFDTRAAAIDTVATRALSNMASARAVSASGGGLTAKQVGDHVDAYLGGLTHMMLRDRLSGAMTAAMNAGRRAFMSEAGAANYYSSEILDVNTCAACSSVDGTEYPNLEATEQDYPAGGFVDCEGGDRCRGTIIAVYREENADPGQQGFIEEEGVTDA
jgi:hypothetical protein